MSTYSDKVVTLRSLIDDAAYEARNPLPAVDPENGVPFPFNARFTHYQDEYLKGLVHLLKTTDAIFILQDLVNRGYQPQDDE